MKRLYIIGPVTGFTGDNREAFLQARHTLEICGYKAVIPHDLIAPGTPWPHAMRISIRNMLGNAIDGVAHLDQEPSKGSRLEAAIAKTCGLPVRYVHEWELKACGAA